MSRTKVIVHPPGLDHQDAAPLRAQRGLEVVHAERARRSRCSTTMVVAAGSAASRANRRHLAFIPEPTSVTTSSRDASPDRRPRTTAGNLTVQVSALIV